MIALMTILASVALPVAAAWAVSRAQRQAVARWWAMPEGERGALIYGPVTGWQVAALVGSLSLVWLVAVAANV